MSPGWPRGRGRRCPSSASTTSSALPSTPPGRVDRLDGPVHGVVQRLADLGAVTRLAAGATRSSGCRRIGGHRVVWSTMSICRPSRSAPRRRGRRTHATSHDHAEGEPASDHQPLTASAVSRHRATVGRSLPHGSPVLERRADAIADPSLGGRDLCRRLSAVTDDWLAGSSPRPSRTSRAARVPSPWSPSVGTVGASWRRSDIDVVLVHEGGKARDLEEVAGAMWYPLWDSGVLLGHAVRSFDEQLAIAADDLDTRQRCSPRGGSPATRPAPPACHRGTATWRRNGRRWLDPCAATSSTVATRPAMSPTSSSRTSRTATAVCVTCTRCGGADAELAMPAEDLAVLDRCYDSLSRPRVELHRETGAGATCCAWRTRTRWPTRLGAVVADELMAEIAAAARIDRLDRRRARGGRPPRAVAARGGGRRRAGRGRRRGRAGRRATSPPIQPWCCAAIAAAGATSDLGRSTLDRLATEIDPGEWPERWPDGALDELVALLRQGHRAIHVLEALDQRGLLVELLPEWAPVRSRPQRNAYHRFTVDRHLWEAAANAAALDRSGQPTRPARARRAVPRPRQGLPGDHTAAGMELMAEIGPRLGLRADDVATLVRLVQHHLLLPEVAMRRRPHRSGHDPVSPTPSATRDSSCCTRSPRPTRLATGPSAWGSWKAQLVVRARRQDPPRARAARRSVAR